MMDKNYIKSTIVDSLSMLPDIEKIIVFGSFITSDTPADLDIAVFSSSHENYLSLALNYRKSLRSLSKLIPLDILPFRSDMIGNVFLNEINSGEVIYERRNSILA